MPRPTRLRKKAPPPDPVNSGPRMSIATAAAMDALGCRLMKPMTATATVLSWENQSSDAHTHLLEFVNDVG